MKFIDQQPDFAPPREGDTEHAAKVIESLRKIQHLVEPIGPIGDDKHPIPITAETFWKTPIDKK